MQPISRLMDDMAQGTKTGNYRILSRSKKQDKILDKFYLQQKRRKKFLNANLSSGRDITRNKNIFSLVFYSGQSRKKNLGISAINNCEYRSSLKKFQADRSRDLQNISGTIVFQFNVQHEKLYLLQRFRSEKQIHHHSRLHSSVQFALNGPSLFFSKGNEGFYDFSTRHEEKRETKIIISDKSKVTNVQVFLIVRARRWCAPRMATLTRITSTILLLSWDPKVKLIRYEFLRIFNIRTRCNPSIAS